MISIPSEEDGAVSRPLDIKVGKRSDPWRTGRHWPSWPTEIARSGFNLQTIQRPFLGRSRAFRSGAETYNPGYLLISTSRPTFR